MKEGGAGLGRRRGELGTGFMDRLWTLLFGFCGDRKRRGRWVWMGIDLVMAGVWIWDLVEEMMRTAWVRAEVLIVIDLHGAWLVWN